MPLQRPRNDERLPAHAPLEEGLKREGRPRLILMTPWLVAVGGMIAFFTVVALVVVLPTATYDQPVSDNWLPLSDQALAGRAVYLANGCVYCHSGFSRPQDNFVGQYYLYTRVSEPGDYFGQSQSPNLLGTERTGPDLSQEGGHHPDSWHQAHYANPRYTQPPSIMPRFDFLSDEDEAALIAFNQSQGGKEGMLRYAAIIVGNKLMTLDQGHLSPDEAFPQLAQDLRSSGELVEDGKPSDKSPWGLPWGLVWHINSFARSYWLTDDPLPLTQQNLVRGRKIFMERCVGCHGVSGDGKGPAADFFRISPFDFTRDDLESFPGASDGMLYHRILTAGPGTAMENFGTRLSVEDIWRVVLFLRTIPNGGLTESIPTVDMYEDWKPAPPFLDYIADHPVDEQTSAHGGANGQVSDDGIFRAAAHWVAPGMDANDEILVGGKLPMTLDRLTSLIQDQYFALIQQAYDDAAARGDDLPSRDQIFSIEGVQWHAP